MRLRRLRDAGRATLAAFQARRAAAGGRARARAGADPAAGASAVLTVAKRELDRQRDKLGGGGERVEGGEIGREAAPAEPAA